MLKNEELLVIAGLLLCSAGCCTECSKRSTEKSQPDRLGVSVSGAARSSVKVESWTSIQAAATNDNVVIGRVVCHAGILSVQKKGNASITVRQSVVLCVLHEQKLVPLASAVITPENGMLRLDVRNVPDEDGDLVAVTDGTQLQEFRKNAVEYIVRHQVLAVKMAFEGIK